MGLQNAGLNVALLEPGSGAKNALKRGVKNVIWAALGDSALQPQSLPAAGAFDVVEHIEDDVAFLSSIRELLLPGGRFYCTVPAIKSLWSAEDVHAGHYRRYTKGTLRELLETAGFEVEYTSFLFSWLVIPVFLFRSLPWRLRGSKPLSPPDVTSAAADHSLPDWLSGIVRKIHETEQKRVQRLRLIPFGTSLICVARKR
jgi:SAM-dependent methyltransferase